MPDYSLPRNNPQPQQRPSQAPPPQQQTPLQTSPPMTQFQAKSDLAKSEAENALLREALATSVQNCEALMKQLVESQKEFNHIMTTRMAALQNQVSRAGEVSYHSLKEMTAAVEDYSQAHSKMIDRYSESHHNLIEQHSQSHQSQLSKLMSMNEAFSESLNDVLSTTNDKLISQVKEDAKAALEANCDTMLSIIETMKIASNGVNDMVEDFNKNLNATYKKSKAILDNRANGYHSSMAKLFKVDGWRQVVFWLGVWGGIATPILLGLNLIFKF